jgi:hypothetical protein
VRAPRGRFERDWIISHNEVDIDRQRAFCMIALPTRYDNIIAVWFAAHPDGYFMVEGSVLRGRIAKSG